MSKLKYYDGTNWKIVNGQITGDTLPIGAIVPFGGWDAPTGWLICDGTLLNKTAYPELFNVLGYSYGGEDGGDTFGLPDLRGRVPVGEKDSDSDFDGMGVTGGEKTHTLTINEIPAHTHVIPSKQSAGDIGTDKANAGGTGSWATNNNTTSSVGGGQAHNNLQPYQTVNYIIKAKQSAGVVANVSNTSSNSQVDTYSCNYINGIKPDILNGVFLYSNSGITTASITSNNGYGRCILISSSGIFSIQFQGTNTTPTILDLVGTHSFTASVSGNIVTLSNLDSWDHYIFFGSNVITNIE